MNKLNSGITPPHSQIRDSQLDIYRALVMMYILCVIHISYWLGLAKEPWLSLMLIEMPVIFFISGAAMSLQTKRKTFRQTLTNRCRRLVVPYYVYLLFCIIAVAGYVIISKNYEVWDTNRIIRSFLFQETMPVPKFSHIWFILPYLIIFLLFWFEQRIADKVNRHVFMALLLISCFLVMLIKVTLIREVVIYNFFFMAGYFYYRKCSKWFLVGILLASLACMAGLQLTHLGTFIPMQLNKFPPHPMFLFFGISALSALGLIFTYVKLPQNRLTKRWNDYGYTIYLWQNFIITAVGLIVLKFFANGMPLGARFLIASVLIFVLATITSYVTVPLEKRTIQFFENKKSGKIREKANQNNA